MADELPLVSIVIPAYNHAGYLDEAIASVLNQDYSNVELIVIDDGSTDHTREVLQKYDRGFYWETQENVGQSETLNKGWRMSRGEVLAYLSADDALRPNAVSTSVKHLQANKGVVLTYCDFELIDADSRVVRRRVEAPELSYRDMVVNFVCPSGPGSFFLRGAYEAAGPWNGSLRRVPDHEHLLRLGLQGRFLKIPEVLASFRVHDASQSFTESGERASEEFLEVISEYYANQSPPPDVVAAKREALSNAHIITARAHLTRRRYSKGLSHLLEGLYLYPRNLLAVRTLGSLARGLLNHPRHRVKRALLKAFEALRGRS